MKDLISKHIANDGQHVFFIGGYPAFSYTIGNHEQGLPELLVIGSFPPAVVGGMLNQMGAMMREQGKAFDEGLLDIEWSMPVKVRKATDAAKSEYTIQVGQYYGSQDYSVLQVMVPDRDGRYPGDEGVDDMFNVPMP